jgi:hypothetical protein
VRATATKTDCWEIAPVIEVKGEITNSNFPSIRDAITEGLAKLNLSPQTDEEFGQAEQDAKSIKALEKALWDAKDEALKQAADVQKLFADIDETTEDLREARRELTTSIKAKKAEVRANILDDALGVIPGEHASKFRAQVEAAMKGKRTIDSLTDAAQSTATEIRDRIHKARAVIESAGEKHGPTITRGAAKLEIMSEDALTIELERRVEAKQAAEEAARAKAEADAERKRLQAEAAAEREKARKSEAEKKAAEPPATAKPETIPESASIRQHADRMPQRPKPEPTPTLDDECKAEFEAFLDEARKCFGQLKQAIGRLKFESNKAFAAVFAKAVNAAWAILTKKGGAA